MTDGGLGGSVRSTEALASYLLVLPFFSVTIDQTLSKVAHLLHLFYFYEIPIPRREEREASGLPPVEALARELAPASLSALVTSAVAGLCGKSDFYRLVLRLRW